MVSNKTCLKIEKLLPKHVEKQIVYPSKQGDKNNKNKDIAPKMPVSQYSDKLISEFLIRFEKTEEKEIWYINVDAGQLVNVRSMW